MNKYEKIIANYVVLVQSGVRTIESVPSLVREEVQKRLAVLETAKELTEEGD